MRTESVERNWSKGDLIADRWEVVDEPLIGGMGIVYVVADRLLNEILAAKTYREEVFQLDPTIARRFVEEAALWIDLDAHPNVVEARYVHRAEGKPFLMLEYVPNGSLRTWMLSAPGAIDPVHALRFGLDFCHGMMHAAAKQLRAHGDIKPENCLLTGNGNLKVTDFGLARALTQPGHDRSLEAHSGHPGSRAKPAGSWEYMAPEQFETGSTADIRTDVYSFGVMLFELLAWYRPFHAKTRDGYARAHAFDKPPPLDGVDAGLARLVHACLAKDAVARPADFSEIREYLARCFQALTGRPAPEPIVGQVLDAARMNEKGVCFARLDRNREALPWYDRALEYDPGLVTAWINKGVALAALQEWTGALTCYDQAIELDDRESKAWFNKGIALRALGELERALHAYDRALEIDPQDKHALVNKALVLHKLDRPQDAIAACKRALAIDDRLPEAWYNKGVAHGMLHEYPDAIHCYRNAVAQGNMKQAWCNMGNAHAALEDPEEALACYNAALRIDEDYEPALLNKGRTLHLMGAYEAALDCYRRALALDDRNPLTRLLIQHVLDRLAQEVDPAGGPP